MAYNNTRIKQVENMAESAAAKQGFLTMIMSLAYARTGIAADLQSDLEQIAALDKMAESKQKTFLVLALIFFAGSAVLALSAQGLAAGVVAVIALMLLGYCLYWGKLNVPNERHELPRRVVALLSRDCETTSPIAIKIDLSNTISNNNRVPRQVGQKMDRAYYRNQWLHITGRMTDGTKYSIRLTEAAQVKFRKSKTKRKGAVIQLVLVYPTKRYELPENIRKIATGAVKLPVAWRSRLRLSIRQFLPTLTAKP
jgi:hypothetical protein